MKKINDIIFEEIIDFLFEDDQKQRTLWRSPRKYNVDGTNRNDTADKFVNFQRVAVVVQKQKETENWSIVSYAKKLNELAENLFGSYKGRGCYRRVYEINDEKLLKIATNDVDSEEGIYQNKLEVNNKMTTKYSDIFPKVYERAPDFAWFVVEKVKVISTSREFITFFPKKFRNETRVLTWIGLAKQHIINGKKLEDVMDYSIYAPNKIMLRLAEYAAETDADPYEFAHGNVGINSKGNFILLDSSIFTFNKECEINSTLTESNSKQKQRTRWRTLRKYDDDNPNRNDTDGVFIHFQRVSEIIRKQKEKEGWPVVKYLTKLFELNSKLKIWRLDAGGFRTAYDLENGRVLKMARSSSGMRQNEREISNRMVTKYPDLFPKVYERSPDFAWFVVEKVTPFAGLDSAKFIEFFPGFEKPTDLITWLEITVNAFKGTLGAWWASTPRFTQIKAIEPNRLMNRILQYVLEFDAALKEFRTDNVGLTEDGEFVLLDSSIIKRDDFDREDWVRTSGNR